VEGLLQLFYTEVLRKQVETRLRARRPFAFRQVEVGQSPRMVLGKGISDNVLYNVLTTTCDFWLFICSLNQYIPVVYA
jgi:hypothetical protein